MASRDELADEALQHALTTSWDWDRYLAEIRNNPQYAYKNTAWYEAGACLEEAKHVSDEPEASGLETARGRIFLANSPLDCLAAPSWMVPVCTADPGYANWYDDDVFEALYNHFGLVEAWCDCREPDGNPAGTPFSAALEMVEEYNLDGAWGQCESPAEFDHAYAAGARRMVGNLSALDQDQIDKVASASVLVSAELYRNLQPSMQPDWRNANAGIGGNCIACYESDSEGAIYTPVQSYINASLYVSGHDSVYGVGLKPDDWSKL